MVKEFSKDYDNKAKSLLKKPCDDNGPDLPTGQEQYDAGVYKSH